MIIEQEFDSTMEFFEFAQNEINEFLLNIGYDNKIKKRYWIKKQIEEVYFTIQFVKTKRLSGFTLNFGLFIPLIINKPKPTNELLFTSLNRITDRFKPEIRICGILAAKEKLNELIKALKDEIIPNLEDKLLIKHLKKTFPNINFLNEIYWLPKNEKLIREYLDNFTPS